MGSFNRLLIKKLGITLPLHSQDTAAVKVLLTGQNLPAIKSADNVFNKHLYGESRILIGE